MTSGSQDIQEKILELLPDDGSTMGNMAVMQALSDGGSNVTDEDYHNAKEALLAAGLIVKGRGRGGSIAKVLTDPSALVLEVQATPEEKADEQKPVKRKSSRKKAGKKSDQTQVLSYRYDDKRKNNPHVGMVDTHSDGIEEKKTWRYDPHLDPELQFDSSASRSQVETLIDDALESGDQDRMKAALQELKRLQSPYLQWTGKAERTSFEVDTVSLHVHERIDPATILAAVQKRIKDFREGDSSGLQSDLFSAPFENLPMHQAIDFYKHERDWANRLIAGDSLLVMNSLLEKEGMAGQVQMIYIDPPYGIKYGSNFQPFTNKKPNQTLDKEQDLSVEPEMIRAFRDTWELGTHSYLTYLRDRLLLSKELLANTGSIFVQISDENLHHVKELLDEVFGSDNFMSIIAYRTKIPLGTTYLASIYDYLLWFAQDKSQVKFRKLFEERQIGSGTQFNKVRLPTLKEVSFSQFEYEEDQLPKGSSVYRGTDLVSSGLTESCVFNFSLDGKLYSPKSGKSWKTNPPGMERAIKARKIIHGKTMPSYRFEVGDFPVQEYANVWTSTQGASDKAYVVETNDKVIERCLTMTTDPGDLVFDPTCGGGTTAYVSEKWGRRWITCDTSRVATTLAKQRLLTASYDYYELKYPQEGLRGGFIYKTVPHITLKSVANNPEIDQIYARTHPSIVDELTDLNTALKSHKIEYVVSVGGRNGKLVRFDAADTETIALPSGQSVQINALLEWEVPFEFPEDWPEEARGPFEAFHAARQSMQQQMNDSIASHAGQEILYDEPTVSKDKLRITGPFTVEAVPFPTVMGLDEVEKPVEADAAIARSGATSQQAQWREELLKAGIRGKGGQQLKLMDLEPLPGTHYIHAVGTVAESGDRVAVSFGPEHAALEQRQVEIAMREASELFPVPKMLLFCAFTFDPEAAKDIDAIKGIQALKAQMNTDLLTEDLKKGRASNESFWLMGQPEVEVHNNEDGTLTVEVHGFDYFDTKTGELKSGGKKNIAMWSLDTDYDNRSLYPRQVFFPMAGTKDGWYKLKKDIRAELNEDLLEQFHGTVSLPFSLGDNKCLAVKIVDDRGIESLKVIRLD